MKKLKEREMNIMIRIQIKSLKLQQNLGTNTIVILIKDIKSYLV